MKKAVWVFSVICATLLVALVALASFARPAARPAPGEDGLNAMSDGWAVTVNGVGKGAVAFPGVLSAGAGDEVRLVQEIPPHVGDYVLALRTNHKFLTAYVDGAEVYRYGDAGALPYSQSPGSVWNFIPLAGGQEIELVLSSPYDGHAGNMNEMLVGTREALLLAIVSEHLPAFATAALSVLVSAILVLAGIFLIARYKNAALLLFGLFCFFVTTWQLVETRVLDLFINLPFLITQLTYLSLMVAPAFLLLFLRSALSLQDDDVTNYLLVFGMLCIAACMLLQLFGVVDLYATLRITHILMLVSTLYIFYILIRERQKLDRTNRLLFITAFCSFAVFSCADVFLYVLFLTDGSGYSTDRALFTRIGFLLFMVLMAIGGLRQGIAVFAKGAQAQVLEKMVATDMMTGLYSRRAFDTDMDTMALGDAAGEVALVLFDMNNLKQVNDTYGHKRGDDLIIATAKAIHAVFAPRGRCYRIGGDEFIVLLPHATQAQLDGMINEFLSDTEAYNSQGTLQIDVAIGSALYTPGQDVSLYALFSRVDDIMYRDKREKKGDTRRAALP